MKLYDFSIYARRRAERKAAQAVAEVAADLSRPGVVPVLKQKVTTWFDLHQKVTKRSA